MRATATILVVAIGLLAAVLGHGQETPTMPEVTGGDELVKERGRFRETWVHPDSDLTRYDKLYLWQSVFNFRDVGEARRNVTVSSFMRERGPYAITEESKSRFERVVAAAFVKELQKSKQFEVVDQPGPNTLLVRALVVDISSNVPIEATSRTEVYLSAIGEATFLFELIDAESGVVQARAGERREIQAPGVVHHVSTIPANAATIWAGIERWADEVGGDLRKALDKAAERAARNAPSE